jgi:phosphate transport system permease protein
MSSEAAAPPPAPLAPPGPRQPRSIGGGRRRTGSTRASLLAYGEPMVWLTGGALALSLFMIAGLLFLVLWFGVGTFWPLPVVELATRTGETYLGEVTEAEDFAPDKTMLESLPDDVRIAVEAELAAAGGLSHRRMLRTGNFELTRTHYTWVPQYLVARESLPEWAVVVERLSRRDAVGRFYGMPVGFKIDGQSQAATSESAWALFQQHHPACRARLAERRELEEAQRRSGEAAAHLQQEADKLRAENDRYLLVMHTAGGAEVDLHVADIVRAYPANQLDLAGKLGVYTSRWWEFLTQEPREANTEGGVFPAIFGTVCMTLLMSLAVVPFGVLAALYLREYAKAGPIISGVRIAINNLAGVPSIVFGVFGLGFFCYLMGGAVDDLFFSARAATGDPTFGKPALIWASLTLALLTLPVVIVATEEALSAVPNSMREGSYACGASKWQTIRRIVLPRAMPGIMTGLILAMARGAGEVAPLMLVGASALAPDLAIDGTFPFVHPERSFMHLGFQIYDVGFQSPNSEAGKPMVFTITLLLIVVVAVMNLAAVLIRSRLRRKFVSQRF